MFGTGYMFFPCLALVTCFPALGIGYMFSRAWHWLHVFFLAWHWLHAFPRLALSYRAQPELGIYMFSRALCRRLALATNFPSLATGCTFVALGVISISFAWFFGSFASVYFGWPDGVTLGLVSDVTVIERRVGQTVAF